MSNSIQTISNSLYTTNDQSTNSTVYSTSENKTFNFESLLLDTSNVSNVNYSMLSHGISNVPTGIITGVNLINTTTSSSQANNLSLVNTVTNNTVGNTTSDIIDSIVSNANTVDITNSNLTEKQQIEDAVKKASAKYGVDENLIKAVIKTESNFKVNAVSCAGAKGLMQIMPANYKHLGISNPFDVYQNINGGTKLLKEYMDRYNGDVEMALMAYNGGPGRMKNRGVTSIAHIYKMPKETQNYVKKVMNYYRGE